MALATDKTRALESLGYKPSDLAKLIGRGITLIDFFRKLNLMESNRQDFTSSLHLSTATKIFRTGCFQFIPIANTGGHNYSMTLPLEMPPAVNLGSTGLSALPRTVEGRGTGNTILYSEIEIRMPGYVLTKEIIRVNLRDAKTKILENFLEIEQNTEKLNYLDVTGKVECIEEEFKAFHALKTLDTTKPIKDQIDHLMAMLK